LKAERSMTKRPPIRHRRHPDLDPDMATGPVGGANPPAAIDGRRQGLDFVSLTFIT
jgi:hypothetical protein